MDPELLSQIEYFLDPRDQVRLPLSQRPSFFYPSNTTPSYVGADHHIQTGRLEDQQQPRYNPAAGSNASTQNIWDQTGANLDSGLGSPSTAPTNLSFESTQQSTPTTHKPSPNSIPQPTSEQGPRVILEARAPKSKSGHERKRTKLSTESTPFDNVDYWIQFDNEEGAADEPLSPELSHQKAKEAQQQLRETQEQQRQQQEQSQQKQQR